MASVIRIEMSIFCQIFMLPRILIDTVSASSGLLPLPCGQVLMNGGGGLASGAHGEDDRGASGDNVATGKDAALGGAHGLIISHNVIPLIGGKIRRGALDEGIGGGADADDDHVRGQHKFRSLDHDRPAAAALV